MTTADAHDRAVQRLAAALEGFGRESGRVKVFVGTRWTPMEDFPNCSEVFDILVFRGSRRVEFTAKRTIADRRMCPVTVIDVVGPTGFESEFYDRPGLLAETGVSEYVLWDPRAEVMRPSLQVLHRWEKEWRQVRTAKDGVFFSWAGCRLDFVGEQVTAAPCGVPSVEEDLYELRQERRSVTDPRTLDEIDQKIAMQEEQLRRPRRGRDE